MKKTLTLLPLLAFLVLLVVAASMPKYVGRFYGDGVGLTNLTEVVSATNLIYSAGTNAAKAYSDAVTNISTLKTSGSNIVDAISVAELNAGTLTLTNKVDASNICLSTNQGAVLIDMSKRWSAFNTNAAFAISGFSNTDAYLTNVLQHTMIITNTSGSAVKLTWPASVLADLSDSGSYITNQAVFTVVIYPGMGTNAAFKCVK